MRRGVVFGVLLIVAGLVIGVVMAVSSILSVRSAIDGFARIGFDEPTELVFDDSGEYTAYFEGLDIDPSTGAPVRLALTRVGSDEQARVSAPENDVSYDRDGRTGAAVFTIDIPVAGRYQVDAQFAGDDAGSALAFGRDIVGDTLRGILWAVVVGVIVMALGLAVIVVSIARGSFEPRRGTSRSQAPVRNRSAATPGHASGERALSGWGEVVKTARSDPRGTIEALRAARAEPRAAARRALGDDAAAVLDRLESDPAATAADALERLRTPEAPEPDLTTLPPPPPSPERAGPEPEVVTAPELEPEPEVLAAPEVLAEPEPEALAAPEPEPLAAPEPEPEPEVLAAPEPESLAEPELDLSDYEVTDNRIADTATAGYVPMAVPVAEPLAVAPVAGPPVDTDHELPDADEAGDGDDERSGFEGITHRRRSLNRS